MSPGELEVQFFSLVEFMQEEGEGAYLAVRLPCHGDIPVSSAVDFTRHLGTSNYYELW